MVDDNVVDFYVTQLDRVTLIVIMATWTRARNWWHQIIVKWLLFQSSSLNQMGVSKELLVSRHDM